MANSKLGKNKQSNSAEQSKHGYWKYKDGYSYWGIGLYRKLELPVEISKEEYLKEHNIK